MGSLAQPDPYAQVAQPDPYAQLAQPNPAAQNAQPSPAAQNAQPPSPPPTAAPQSLGQKAQGVADRYLQANDDPVHNLVSGAIKGGMQTVGGLFHILAKTANGLPSYDDVAAYHQQHPELGAIDTIRGAAANPTPTSTVRQDATSQAAAVADWFNSRAKEDGFMQHVGGVGESVAEFLTPGALAELGKGAEVAEGTVKVATKAEQLARATKAAKLFQEHPVIAGLVGHALRAAAEASGQAYIKTGGDTGAAETAGVLGAGGSAALEGVLSGVGAAVQHLSPEEREVAGKILPFLKSQVSRVGEDGLPQRPSPLQRAAATTGNSQGVVDQQAAGAMDTIREQARQVLDRELRATNAARATANEGAGAEGGASRPTVEVDGQRRGSQVTVQDAGGPELSSGAPQLGAGTPELGAGDQAPLAKNGMVGDIVSPSGAQGGAFDSTQKELGSGAASAPPKPYQLHPVDIKGALATTNDFGDAADHLHAAAQPVYDRLNEVTGGQWQAADQQIRGLQGKVWKTVGPEREQLQQQLNHARGVMDGLLQNKSAGISPEVLQRARDNYRVGYALRDLHNSLEPAFQVDADFARRTGAYRGLNGTTALSRYRSALRSNPELQTILGTQGSDNLQAIFRANVTMASRQRFGEGVSQVARFLAERSPALGLAGVGYALGGAHAAAELGAAGEGLYAMTKFVLHKVATDPQVGKNLLFAIDSGARPENFAPTVGNLIARKTVEQAKRYAVPAAASALGQAGGGQP